jgi:hypothetical protein
MRGKKREAPKAGRPDQGDLQLKLPGSFRLSDGLKEGVRGSPRVAAIVQSLENAIDEYERKRPQWFTETIFELVSDALQEYGIPAEYQRRTHQKMCPAR